MLAQTLLVLVLVPGLMGFDGCGSRWHMKCGSKCAAVQCQCGDDRITRTNQTAHCCMPATSPCSGKDGAHTISCPGGTALPVTEQCHGQCRYYSDKRNFERNTVASDTTPGLCTPVRDACRDTRGVDKVAVYLFLKNVIVKSDFLLSKTYQPKLERLILVDR